MLELCPPYLSANPLHRIELYKSFQDGCCYVELHLPRPLVENVFPSGWMHRVYTYILCIRNGKQMLRHEETMTHHADDRLSALSQTYLYINDNMAS